MSTLATLAHGRLFLLLRDTVRRLAGTVAASTARTATKPVHWHAPEYDRMADDLTSTPGREIPGSSADVGEPPKVIQFCTRLLHI